MLKHQERKLDLAQFARATAHARVNTLAAEVASLHDQRSKLKESPGPQTRQSAWSIQQASLRSDWYLKQLEKAEASLQQATTTLQERERSLRLARRELRKFEVLKDKRHREWQAQALKLEQKQLDEVGGRMRGAAQFAALPGKLVPAGSASSL